MWRLHRNDRLVARGLNQEAEGEKETEIEIDIVVALWQLLWG